MQAVLEVTAGPLAGRKVVLKPGVAVRIGRTAKADYVMAEDTFLSGAHFYVEWSGDGCTVRDLNSSNGTFLNGQRLTESPFREGDLVTAGQSTFALRLDPYGSTEPAAPSLDQTTHFMAPSFAPSPMPPVSLPFNAPVPPPPAMSSAAASPPMLDDLPLSPPPLMQDAPFPSPHGTVREAPPPPLPFAAPAPEPDGTQSGLIGVLQGLADPIFAILDSTAAGPFIDSVRAGGGAVEMISDSAGACILSVDSSSPIAGRIAAEGWGNGWGILVTARQPLPFVRNHLRRFQTLMTPDGAEFRFRLHDPALLRAFLPTLDAASAKVVFGPITGMLVEGMTPAELLLFMPGPAGAAHKTIPLGPESSTAARR